MKKLRKASYRGVSFEVTSLKMKVGRRVVVFEYPQRDEPFVEDLGKSARTFTVEAFIAGDDYISRMKSLMSACEKEGPGRYVDPWLGAITVFPKSVSSPSFTSNRVASVTIEFVEAGKLQYPSWKLDSTLKSAGCADALVSAAKNVITSVNYIQSKLDYVKNLTATTITEVLDALDMVASVLGTVDEFRSLVDDAKSLVSSSTEIFTESVNSAFTPNNKPTVSYSNSARVMTQAINSRAVQEPPYLPPGLSTDVRTQVQNTTVAMQAYIRRALIGSLAVVASNVGSDNDESNAVSFDDMVEIRDGFLALIDKEMLCAEDVVFDALTALRSAVFEDMTSRAEDKARLVSVTPPDVMPAIVFAYDYYEDANRDLEIVERNNIRHPGFLPSIPLKLLNE